MVKLIKAAAAVILLLVIATVGLNYYLSPLDASNKAIIQVEIPERISVTKIAQILENAKVIKNSYIFKYYVRYKKLDAKLQSGMYKLSPSMSLEEIAAQLQKGEQIRIMFTIPEGFTVQQTARVLSDKGIVDYDTFMNLTKEKKFDYAFINYAAKVNNPLEGYLFPDTYYIPKDFSEEAIINMMLKRFDEVFNKELQHMTEKQNKPVAEIVTLASLVEKEARIAKERPVIAGVFYNRLEKKMRLESCATIQYLLGKIKPVLLYEDLNIVSPYNTYKNGGLPPGPIANPGKASLEAALNPQKSDYLFFVAKSDGSHHFSKTLSEHNKAKNKYLP